MTEDKEGGRYSDPDLERFFRENRRMVERIIREEKEILFETVKAEKKKAEDEIDKQSERVKGFAVDAFAAINDPEVQRHFTAVGIEFLMGLNALIQAAPIPDHVKDLVNSTEHQAQRSAGAAKRAARETKTEPEKVNIDPAPRKSKTAKPKTDE
ncbi:MAG: hypothetical protein LBT41_06130 [Candidatus Methanoplasma sp.]|jgi:hypothetical protein|nr:hypothetical protein [Candidatus Methanoplasma sp.]